MNQSFSIRNPQSAIRNRMSSLGYVPQVAAGAGSGVSRGRAWAAWALTAGGALLFAGLLFSAPLAASAGHEAAARTVYRALYFVCHQMPERSFHVAGHPLAVCARCAGIYFGFAAAALAYPLVRPVRRTDAPARAWLLLAALPLGLDYGLNLAGLRENTHYSRALTGALLGAACVFYVVPGLVDLTRVREFFRTRPAAAEGGRARDF